MKHFLDTVTIASNPLSSLIAFDCVEYYAPEQLKDHFFKQVLMMVFTPICVFLLNIIVWSIGTKVTKYCKSRQVSSKMNTARLVNRISIVTGMWLYLIYPSICEVLLQSVNCFPSLE